MDRKSLCGNIQSCLRIAAFLFLLLQELWLYGDYLLYRHFLLNDFKAGFPYATEPIIIICFCDAMAGTPADNTHASRTALALPDLCGPFLETVLPGYHGCF